MKRRAALERAVRAHSNLSAFASCVAILEGGLVYGGNERTNRAAARVISICKQEQGRLVRDYDLAREEINAESAP